MNDTTPQMTLKMREMILQKSPQERLALGCSMYDFSKQLVKNALLRQNADLSPAHLRRELFLKFYGNDFSLEEQQKIMRTLTIS